MSAPTGVAHSLEQAANALNYAGAKREGVEMLLQARQDFLLLVRAARSASATLSHIYNSASLPDGLSEEAFKDFTALDDALARAEAGHG